MMSKLTQSKRRGTTLITSDFVALQVGRSHARLPMRNIMPDVEYPSLRIFAPSQLGAHGTGDPERIAGDAVRAARRGCQWVEAADAARRLRPARHCSRAIADDWAERAAGALGPACLAVDLA
jgi:hypothetical protein